jgi:hypothetical protein
MLENASGVTDHPQSGWLGFYRHRRENTKARQCLNRCGWNRVQSTRLKTPNQEFTRFFSYHKLSVFTSLIYIINKILQSVKYSVSLRFYKFVNI